MYPSSQKLCEKQKSTIPFSTFIFSRLLSWSLTVIILFSCLLSFRLHFCLFLLFLSSAFCPFLNIMPHTGGYQCMVWWTLNQRSWVHAQLHVVGESVGHASNLIIEKSPFNFNGPNCFQWFSMVICLWTLHQRDWGSILSASGIKNPHHHQIFNECESGFHICLRDPCIWRSWVWFSAFLLCGSRVGSSHNKSPLNFEIAIQFVIM